jgi:hypothetical protein
MVDASKKLSDEFLNGLTEISRDNNPNFLKEIEDLGKEITRKSLEEADKVLLKDVLYLSSAKKYEGVDGFDNYKKNLELPKNSQLPANYVKESKYNGYEGFNNLISKDYSTF